MKILAFSDVKKWEGYQELGEGLKPDAIALAGDLVSDGFASFRRKALARNSKQSLRARKEMHVGGFYRFLEFAGERNRVLAVKGNHDDDFEGDYVPEKINRIPDAKNSPAMSPKQAVFGF